LAGSSFARRSSSTFEIDPSSAADLERLMREADPEHAGFRGIVHLWSLDEAGASADNPAERGRTNVEAVVTVLQSVVRSGGSSGPSTWIVTRGAVAADKDATEGKPLALAQTPLWGLGATFALEHPDLWGGLVDLPEQQSPAVDADLLLREVVSNSGEDQVALRARDRYVPRLVRKQPIASGPIVLSGSSTYVITGGTGVLGLRAARSLVARGARHLVLASRRGKVDVAARAAVRDLESVGARVRVVAADISTSEGIDAVFAAIEPGIALKGIVHAAGIDEVCPIRNLTRAAIDSVTSAKMRGGWLLHQRVKDVPLDFFVSFSSISSILGSSDRGAYSAANAFLDGLAHQRRREGAVGLAVNWGPWSGGGMASDAALQHYQRIGNRGLEPDAAIGLLEQLIADDSTQVMVADIEWNTFRTAYEARRLRPLISELGAAVSTQQAAPDQAPWLDRLRAIPHAGRAAELAVLLRSEVAKTLGFETPESVPVDQTFHDMGMDSLMAADFAQRLQKRLGVRSSALVFQYPYVEMLATHLVEKLAFVESEAPAAAGPPSAVPPPAPQPVPAGAQPGPTPSTVGHSPEIEADACEFQKIAFPDRRPDLVGPRWKWMFVSSAERLGIAPRVWLHRDAGRIVGHNGAIPVRVKIGAEDRLSAWLVDTMVLEEYRSQAVGARLMVEAHEDLPFVLSLGQTDQMRAIQLRLEWEQVAPLQTAQLLIRPERVLKGKLPRPAALAAGLGLRASSAIRSAWAQRPQGQVREVGRFDASHDSLWEEASRDITCAIRRDASYLNWKYVEQPGQSFVRLELVRDGAVRGVIVCMFREPDDVYRYRRAFVVDLVAPFSDAALVSDLIHAGVQASARCGADAVSCLHIGPALTSALKRAGFILRRPSRYLLVRPGNLEGASRQHVLDAFSWYITQGDSDIDRP
jgi:NADP-dependent 3-hydroxy acid dehydrogenase YdfG/acyl carrier protein